MQQDDSREQLVNAGLWNVDDLRDPSKSEEAANELRIRCEETFHCELTHSGYHGAADSNWWVRIMGQSEALAKAGTFPMAMCKAAIELHKRYGRERV
jgi:hypothetical protein